MNRIVSIVGMAGSGKSEVSMVFEKSGFARIRFGDITDEEARKRGLPLNEHNERSLREELRREHGMAAYAKLSLPKIRGLLGTSDVIVDGLYSWEEYTLLKGEYDHRFVVIAVWASPRTRYARLGKRPVRPLTPAEALSRDFAEIENLRKGGPIAMADHTITNESTLTALQEQAEAIVSLIRQKA